MRIDKKRDQQGIGLQCHFYDARFDLAHGAGGAVQDMGAKAMGIEVRNHFCHGLFAAP